MFKKYKMLILIISLMILTGSVVYVSVSTGNDKYYYETGDENLSLVSYYKNLTNSDITNSRKNIIFV